MLNRSSGCALGSTTITAHAAPSSLNTQVIPLTASVGRAEPRLGGDHLQKLILYSVEHSADLIQWVDPTGRILYANESTCRRTGYSGEEILGLYIWDLDIDLTQDAWGERWQRFTRSGSFTIESSHRTKSGEVYPVELSISHVEQDGREYAFAFGRDITERKRAEASLRQSEERFRGVFEQGSVGIAIIGPEQCFVGANPAFCRMLGYEEQELVGRSVLSITAPEDESPSRESIGAMSRGDLAGIEMDKRYLRKDGQVIWAHVSTSLLRDETGQPVGAVAIVEDMTERKRAEDDLRRTQFSVDHAADSVIWLDSVGRIVDVSESACLRLEYTREELLRMTVFDMDPAFPRDGWPEHWEKIKQLGSFTFETLHKGKNGHAYPEEVTTNYVVFGGQEYNCSFSHDISERKAAEKALRESEEQLRQAQKMEAIGQLAGGIAHDFNNVLTTILGYSELILTSDECCSSSLRADVEEIKAAGERASSFTRQILAFSRRQALRPKTLLFNDVLTRMERLLRRTLGENIELVTIADPSLGFVEVDEHQFEQVLVNLALNARDAMPTGGKLTLETANVEVGVASSRTRRGLQPGSYVMLAVSDTGMGMDERTRSHLFEPFFTTKPVGKGTGLGLATVYGVVRQSGGHIFVHSEPANGTTFEVYLPRIDKLPEDRARSRYTCGSLTGNERILVVEDEQAVRNLVDRALSHLGYGIVAAGSGDEALALLEGGLVVDLLLTDVVLPGNLQGNDLVQAVSLIRPNLAVLYMSGYTRDAIVHAGRLDPGVNYIEKPFRPDELAARVRELLDEVAAQ
jgi:two-component system, cell cycle sensor histidine kinase and response regulator CckA